MFRSHFYFFSYDFCVWNLIDRFERKKEDENIRHYGIMNYHVIHPGVRVLNFICLILAEVQCIALFSRRLSLQKLLDIEYVISHALAAELLMCSFVVLHFRPSSSTFFFRCMWNSVITSFLIIVIKRCRRYFCPWLTTIYLSTHYRQEICQ